jgi:AmiR/NasT family two-component response regulator
MALLSSCDDLLAATLAAHAAIELDRATLLTKVAQLEKAIGTNREIGAAVGILMAKRAISYPEGFALLMSSSQNDNRKLHDVASEVLYTGALPPLQVRPQRLRRQARRP